MFKYGPLYLLKGSLDMYNIYIFVPNSIENLKINEHQTFLADSADAVSLYWPFVNSIISRAGHQKILCCLGA